MPMGNREATVISHCHEVVHAPVQPNQGHPKGRQGPRPLSRSRQGWRTQLPTHDAPRENPNPKSRP
eukprot:4539947-Pyramimonas_sp.AAC.1